MSAPVGQVAVIPGSHSLIPYLICKITGSHCYHMIVCTGENECASADSDGVNLHPLTDWPNAVWSRFELTDAERAAVVTYARAQAARRTPYAYLDDGLIAVERIFRFRFPAWVRERFAYDGQLQCAQLCDFALHAAGIKVFTDDRMLGDVFPGSYELEFIRRGWYTPEFFESFTLAWK